MKNIDDLSLTRPHFNKYNIKPETFPFHVGGKEIGHPPKLIDQNISIYLVGLSMIWSVVMFSSVIWFIALCIVIKHIINRIKQN